VQSLVALHDALVAARGFDADGGGSGARAPLADVVALSLAMAVDFGPLSLVADERHDDARIANDNEARLTQSPHLIIASDSTGKRR
jgi:hypothetical protein